MGDKDYIPWSERIRSEGVNEGIQQIVQNLFKKGKTPEEIASLCDIELEKVKSIEKAMLP